MEFGISTQVYRNSRLSLELLESIRKAGYSRIELFCNRPHLDFHDRALLRSIARWFRDNELPPPSMHLPFLENTGPKQKIWFSVLDPERRLRESAMDEIKRSLEFAELLHPAYAVMHFGNPEDTFNPVMLDFGYAAVSQIEAFAGVRIMIENIPNEMSTIERIQEFKSVAGMPDLGICYDSGHAHLQGISGGFEHVQATHMHDNHGKDDEHLWPFEGTIDWRALIQNLAAAKYNGTFVFETRDNLHKGGDVRDRLQEIWEQSQRISLES